MIIFRAINAYKPKKLILHHIPGINHFFVKIGVYQKLIKCYGLKCTSDFLALFPHHLNIINFILLTPKRRQSWAVEQSAGDVKFEWRDQIKFWILPACSYFRLVGLLRIYDIITIVERTTKIWTTLKRENQTNFCKKIWIQHLIW